MFFQSGYIISAAYFRAKCNSCGIYAGQFLCKISRKRLERGRFANADLPRPFLFSPQYG